MRPFWNPQAVLDDGEIFRLIADVPPAWQGAAFQRVRHATWTGWRDIFVWRPPFRRPLCPDDLFGVPPDGTGRVMPLPARENEPNPSGCPMLRPEPQALIAVLPERERPTAERLIREADKLGWDGYHLITERFTDEPPAVANLAATDGNGNLHLLTELE